MVGKIVHLGFVVRERSPVVVEKTQGGSKLDPTRVERQPRERAADRVKKILAEHQPQPLPQDVAESVHAIVERAEARYG